MLRTGGRTHKNKTGFDLIGMFVGSEGLLGVVTEATLRLLPLPPARASLSASFTTFREAAAAVQTIFRRRLPARGFGDRRCVYPALCAGASRASHRARGRRAVLVDLDGQAASVQNEALALEVLLRESEARVVCRWPPGEAACEELWSLRRESSPNR